MDNYLAFQDNAKFSSDGLLHFRKTFIILICTPQSGQYDFVASELLPL